MVKIFYVAFLAVLPHFIFAQKVMLDTLKVDKTTKIIGMYPQYDKSKTYERFNFIIEDSAKIVAFAKNIKLGEEVPNFFENTGFRMIIVKNHMEIGSWTINPTDKSVMTHDGHTYKFDIGQISNFNSQFPFKYRFETKSFQTQAQYNQYIVEQKKNHKFLFDYRPQFKFEGSFEIEFRKSSEFSDPRAISLLLKPYIEKIVREDEYTLGYILNEKNLRDKQQYTMTIQSSRLLFEKLNFKGLKKENWNLTEEKGMFFYKE